MRLKELEDQTQDPFVGDLTRAISRYVVKNKGGHLAELIVTVTPIGQVILLNVVVDNRRYKILLEEWGPT